MGNCMRCWERRSPEVLAVRAWHGPQDDDPIVFVNPGVFRHISQLTEEEQIRIATRMGIITTLPFFTYEEEKHKKLSECIICMGEYVQNEELRCLPCLHTYHRSCIDEWLIRSLTCPSCSQEIQAPAAASPEAVDTLQNTDQSTTLEPTLPTSTSSGDQSSQNPTDDCTVRSVRISNPKFQFGLPEVLHTPESQDTLLGNAKKRDTNNMCPHNHSVLLVQQHLRRSLDSALSDGCSGDAHQSTKTEKRNARHRRTRSADPTSRHCTFRRNGRCVSLSPREETDKHNKSSLIVLPSESTHSPHSSLSHPAGD